MDFLQSNILLKERRKKEKKEKEKKSNLSVVGLLIMINIVVADRIMFVCCRP
jgi:hypothetical protein